MFCKRGKFDMKVLSVLVTGVGGDIGENIIKCLNESSYDLRIYGCDMAYYASGRERVEEFFHSPSATNKREYTEFLKNIVLNKQIDYIFPSSEVELEFFNENAGIFRDINACIIINSKEVLDNFLDKYSTSIFFREHGLPFARTFLVKEYSGDLSYPLIMKKNKGSGSKVVLIIKSDEELVFYTEKYKDDDMIIQEYLGNPDEEYTIGIFADGINCYSIAFRRYLSSDVGVTIYAELTIDKDIEKLGNAIAHAVNLEGAINVQVRKTDRGYIPFEINPRISGTAYVRHRFGFKDVQWCLDLEENQAIEYSPLYKSGIAIRTIKEVFYDLH